MSLPSRERGLKFYIVGLRVLGSLVAPFAGAWIEIHSACESDNECWSLPSRERGLKFGEWIPFT